MRKRVRYGTRSRNTPAPSGQLPVRGVRLPPRRTLEVMRSCQGVSLAGTGPAGDLAEALRELRVAIDQVLPAVESVERRLS